MSLNKKITLTNSSINSGPGYSVYASTDCNTYFLIENVVLANIGDYVIVSVPDTTMCIKLVSLGLCNNSVIHVVPGALMGDFNIDFSQLDFN
jgi:Fe2+ transport system protein FeoA